MAQTTMSALRRAGPTARGTAGSDGCVCAGFGLPGAVNGIGDLAASLIVGGLWTLVSPAAFTCAALAMLAGAVLVFRLR